jgi:hypothetical protein
MMCMRMKFVAAILACWTLSGSAKAEDAAGFDAEVGEWEAKCRMWAEGPDKPPMEFAGTEVNTKLGLCLKSEFKSDFNGESFAGVGLLGIDTKTKKIQGTWADSMSQKLTILEGTYDEAAKTRTLTSDDISPITGQPVKGKQTVALKDDGTRVFTYFVADPPEGGKFVKVMEIVYTKKK